ncbi:c-type cytochrome [Acidicapsa ligni]|uniref:c-type cytochrome n=1 Tax=Acidicapsa ligni TaxID=542300 RepID=UPI0021E09940|nr:c-type cytochrome [Acidicapsa ligni]
MNFSRLTIATTIVVAVASVSLFAGRTLVFAAQGPEAQAAQAQTAPPPPHEMPAPTNLKVLPRNLTGPQVHEIMEKWEGELGTGCKTCHAVDPKNIGPNGKPRLNFADDSKEEKQTARKMFKMVEDINTSYISKIDSSGAPVTCGTCHRGHLGPEPFVPAPEKEHDHAH